MGRDSTSSSFLDSLIWEIRCYCYKTNNLLLLNMAVVGVTKWLLKYDKCKTEKEAQFLALEIYARWVEQIRDCYKHEI